MKGLKRKGVLGCIGYLSEKDEKGRMFYCFLSLVLVMNLIFFGFIGECMVGGYRRYCFYKGLVII